MKTYLQNLLRFLKRKKRVKILKTGPGYMILSSCTTQEELYRLLGFQDQKVHKVTLTKSKKTDHEKPI